MKESLLQRFVIINSFIWCIFCAHVITKNADKNHYRLPLNVKPLHYNINISTDLERDSFYGNVSIKIKIVENYTKNITLHAKNLTIIATRLYKEDGTTHVPISTEKNEALDFFIIKVDNSSALMKNETYIAEYFFNGNLTTGVNVGYYRSSYVNENSQERKLAVTHFEPTNARRAFPCFDELNFKATFEIVLCRNASYLTDSNMPRIKTIPGRNKNEECDVYAKTKPMSTYLVAFFVSDYLTDSIDNYTVYARPKYIKEKKAKYALKIAKSVITNMENFTNIKYALDKIDQVGIPDKDFKIGAMENWGMVTYKESLLLYDSKINTASQKQSIATIICHEFSHQWFGNLVTPVRHKYIWLNEGFATYFERHLLSRIETDWNLKEQFVVTTVHTAMQFDSSEKTRPLSKDAESPEEISALYDKVAYNKGGCVIRMMEHILSPEVFQTGLQIYLRTLQYSNAMPIDLYKSWQIACDSNNLNLNISDIMYSWENFAGFPVVHVFRNYTDNNVVIKQERFFLNQSATQPKNFWTIPINYATEKKNDFNDTRPTQWLKSKNDVLNINNITSNEWLIVNKQQSGFYRVNYDERNWKLLTAYLNSENFDKIHVQNRAQLIDDVFALARSGKVNYKTAFDLMTYLKSEADYVPLYAFNNVLSFLHPLLDGLCTYENFTYYSLSILESVYNKTGFNISESDGHLTKLTKNKVLSSVCMFDYEPCVQNSAKHMNAWRNDYKKTINPDLQSIVYCKALKSANLDDKLLNWQHLLDVYTKNITEEMSKPPIIVGLGCINDPTYIQKNLNMATDNKKINSTNDRLSLLLSVVNNNHHMGLNHTLEFLNVSFRNVQNSFGTSDWITIFTTIANKINTNYHLEKLKSFYASHSAYLAKELKTAIEKDIKLTETNIRWLNNTLPILTEYFDSYKEKKRF